MTINDNIAPLTVGDSAGVATTGYWTPDNGYQYWPNTYPYIPVTYPSITITTTPLVCSGNTHVFGCDHAERCKCGKTKRKPEPPVCGHCGKAHG